MEEGKTVQTEQTYKTPKIVGSYSYNHLKGNNNNNNNNNLDNNNNNNNEINNNNSNNNRGNNKFNNVNNTNGNGNDDFPFSNKIQKNSSSSTNNNNNYSNNVQQKEDELRQTLKRSGAPKINAKQLPSAFGNITSTNKKQKNQFMNNQNNPVKIIDDMVDISEYKQAQNMLTPIEQTNDKKKQKIKQQSQSNNPSQKIQQSNNPIGPIKKYMVNYTKLDEEIKSSKQDFSIENINKMYAKQPHSHSQHENLQNNNQHNNNNNNNSSSNNNKQYNNNKQIQDLSQKIQLQEMITLGLMKGNKNTGLIKKMLHAPTLSLYAIKEEPISNKEVRTNLKEWTGFWQQAFQDSDLHIKVFGSFWNTPEGCVSILLEHVGGGSLQNLLESVGCLNERTLKEICQQILGSLQILHIEHQVCHGALNPSQIIFTKEGTAKLSLGISYRVNPQNNQFTSLGKAQDRMSLYDPSALQTPNLFNKQLENKQNNNSFKCDENDKAEDLFKFGLMMLVAAIGNLEIMDNHSVLFENMKILLDECQKNPKKYQQDNVCCIIHSEELIYNIQQNNNNTNNNNNENNQQQQQQVNQNPIVTINTLLKQDRLSSHFIDFICCCTQIQASKRYNVVQLSSHPFITQRKLENKSPKIYLRDLIKISSHWNQQSLPVEFQGASELQLNRLVDAMSLVLPNSEKWFTSSQYNEHVRHLLNLNINSPAIDAIATDLGMNPETVLKKIQDTYLSNQAYANYARRFQYKNKY